MLEQDKILDKIYNHYDFKDPQNYTEQDKWLEDNKNVIIEVYREENTENKEEECINCGRYTKTKYCSLDCFASDIGL